MTIAKRLPPPSRGATAPGRHRVLATAILSLGLLTLASCEKAHKLGVGLDGGNVVIEFSRCEKPIVELNISEANTPSVSVWHAKLVDNSKALSEFRISESLPGYTVDARSELRNDVTYGFDAVTSSGATIVGSAFRIRDLREGRVFTYPDHYRSLASWRQGVNGCG